MDQLRSFDDSGSVLLSNACLSALRACFDHLDQDEDGALDFEEMRELFRVSSGLNLTQEEFRQLQVVLETDIRGNISFQGFVKLFLLEYRDNGAEKGDAALKKDLEKFGFNCDLQHVGNFPPPLKVKPKNAFSMLGKKKHGEDKKRRSSTQLDPFKIEEFKKKPKKNTKESEGPVDPFFLPRAQREQKVILIDDKDDSVMEFAGSRCEHWKLPEFPDEELVSVNRSTLNLIEPSRREFPIIDDKLRTSTEFESLDFLKVKMRLNRPRNALPVGLENMSGSLLNPSRVGVELGPFLKLKASQSQTLCWQVKYSDAIVCSLYEEIIKDISSWLETWTSVNGHQAADFDRSRGSHSSAESWALSEVEVPNITGYLIEAPSSSFKSCLVHYLANQGNLKVIEIHAGMSRSGLQMKNAIGEATQSRVIGKQHMLYSSLILIDDVDIVFEEDKAFYSCLRDLVKQARCPVLMTCSKIPKQFIHAVQSNVNACKIERLSEDKFLMVLKCIVIAEGLRLDEQHLKLLYQLRRGDLKGALNDLEAAGPNPLFSPFPAAEWIDEEGGIDERMDPLSYRLYEESVCGNAMCRFHLDEKLYWNEPELDIVKPAVGSDGECTEARILGKNLLREDMKDFEVTCGDQECEVDLKNSNSTSLEIIIPPQRGKFWPMDVHVRILLDLMIILDSRANAAHQHNSLFQYSKAMNVKKIKTEKQVGGILKKTENMKPSEKIELNCGHYQSLQAIEKIHELRSFISHVHKDSQMTVELHRLGGRGIRPKVCDFVLPMDLKRRRSEYLDESMDVLELFLLKPTNESLRNELPLIQRMQTEFREQRSRSSRTLRNASYFLDGTEVIDEHNQKWKL